MLTQISGSGKNIEKRGVTPRLSAWWEDSEELSVPKGREGSSTSLVGEFTQDMAKS